MVRYDPNKDDHKVYEVNKNNKSSSKVKSVKVTNDSDSEPTNDVVETDNSQFYEIKDDIKNLFCKNEMFQFKFLGDKNDDDDEEEVNVNTKNDLKDFSNLKRSLDSNRNDLNRSFESSDDDDESMMSDNEPPPQQQQQQKSDIKSIKQSFSTVNFIPDLNDSVIQGLFKSCSLTDLIN